MTKFVAFNTLLLLQTVCNENDDSRWHNTRCSNSKDYVTARSELTVSKPCMTPYVKQTFWALHVQ
jgi:hypothetical protein